MAGDTVRGLASGGSSGLVAGSPRRSTVRWCPARAVGRRRGGRAGRARAGRAPATAGRADRRGPAAGRRLVRGVRADRVAAAPGQPQRPAHDGHRLRLPPRRRCSARTTRCSRPTAASWLSDLWTLFFIPLRADLLHGRPAAHHGGPGTARRRGRRDRRARPALAGLRRRPGHAPARASRPRGRRRDRHACSAALYLAISVGTAAVVAARWRRGVGAGPAGDAAERRRRGLPAAVGGAARRRPRRRRRAPRGPALDRGLLARARAGGVPRRACSARGWPAAAWPTCSASCARCSPPSCRRRWPGCCTTRSSRSPTPARTAGSSTSDGRRSTCPSRRRAGRSRGWSATACRSPR